LVLFSLFIHICLYCQIKFGHRELTSLFNKFGVTDEQVVYSRKVAALQALIALDADGMGDAKRTTAFRVELQILLRETDVLISIQDFIEECFPPAGEQRDFELRRISAVMVSCFSVVLQA
jgi:hypothetical protein